EYENAGDRQYSAGRYAEAVRSYEQSLEIVRRMSLDEKKLRAEKFWNEKERIVEFISKDMVHVTGGVFTMGCTLEQGDGCLEDQKPIQLIELSDFFISKYEVTQKQYEALMGDNPSKFSDCGECPVE